MYHAQSVSRQNSSPYDPTPRSFRREIGYTQVVSGTNDGGARFGSCGGAPGAVGAGTGGSTGGGNGHGDGQDSSDMGSTAGAPDSITCASIEDLPSMRNNVRVWSMARREGAERMLEGVEDTGGQRRHRTSGMAALGGGGGGGGVGGDEGVDDILESDDEQAVEDMVPSRTFLKLCSSRQHTETIRKIESDERKKKLAERMEAADETEKATLTSKLARKRQQDLAMVSCSEAKPELQLLVWVESANCHK